MHRLIVQDKDLITEYQSIDEICEKYSCSKVMIYVRIRRNNANTKCPIFGKDIMIYRLPGRFNDPIDEDDLPNGHCDMCLTPVRYKDILCSKCDEL